MLSSSKSLQIPGGDNNDSSSDSYIAYDPSGSLFDNSVGSNLSNSTISDDASSFDSSKLVYGPGGDRSNSSTKADSAHNEDESPRSDTDDKSDDCDFVYDPDGDHLDNNSHHCHINNNPSTSNSSDANHCNANKGSSDNVHPYELVQAANLVINAVPAPPAYDHPFLTDLRHADATGPSFSLLTLKVEEFVFIFSFCVGIKTMCSL